MSLSVDSSAYAASAPKGIPKVLSYKARAKALSSANHLRSKVANKAPQRASPPSSSSAKLFVAKLRECPQVLIAVLMQLQHIREFLKFLTAKLELKHYLVLVTSVAMKRTRRRPMRNPTQPLC